MDKPDEISYRKMPVPSGPGAAQITVVGQDSMKGGAPFTSKLPKDYVIPDGAAGEGFNKRSKK